MTKARTLADNFAADINEITASAPLTGGGTSGAVTVGIQDGTTSQKGAVQLEDSTASTSTTKASTPNSVKSAYDLANGAIAKSTIDAKGDLLVGTANDTVSRLAVASTAGYLLAVDSGETTGLKWAAPSSGALTKIATGEFSNESSVAVDSVFTTTYRNYLVYVNVYAATASDDFQVQFRYAGPTTQTGQYYGAGYSYDRNNTLTTYGFVDASQATISQDTAGVGGKSVFAINFGYVGIASANPVLFGSGINGNGQKTVNYVCLNDTQRTYTGFLMKSSSTNITGSYQVYGLEK